MSLGISSFFRSKMEATVVNSISYSFTLNNSEIDSRVIRYGTVARDYTDLVGHNFSVDIENASQIFNDLILEKQRLLKDGVFQFGFTTDTGSQDLVQFFGGELVNANFQETKLRLVFEDKFARLSTKTVGTDETPVSFTNTNINPADLAWFIQSSYGGISDIKSTSNPDVDFPTWDTWRQQLEDDNITVQANFQGEDVLQILQTIAKLTDSFIFDEGDNKIDYFRWSGVISASTTMTASETTKILKAQITAKDIINEVNVSFGYDVTSEEWAGSVTQQQTSSVNTYGRLPQSFDDTSVWYVDSSAALNFAQRITFKRRDPNLKMRIETPLRHLDITATDVVVFSSDVYSLSSVNLVVQGYKIDFEKKTMQFDASEGFGRGAGNLQGFILDDAVFGLLDQDYNFLL